MNRGDRVRVVAPASVFNGREGTLRDTRPLLLPFGVKVDGHRGGLIWCAASELEVVS